MAEMSNEEFVRRYVDADIRQDFAAMEPMRHTDWRLDWPQSGERITSDEAYRAVHENYPGGLPHGDVDRMVGSEDRYVVSPMYTVQRLRTGDLVAGTPRPGTGRRPPEADGRLRPTPAPLFTGKLNHRRRRWRAAFFRCISHRLHQP